MCLCGSKSGGAFPTTPTLFLNYIGTAGKTHRSKRTFANQETIVYFNLICAFESDSHLHIFTFAHLNMNSTLTIRPATVKDIKIISSLADDIWPPTYQDILSSDQVRYMMDLFYSHDSLRRQIIEQKHQFVIMEDDIAPIGFASFSPIGNSSIYKLHKIYVLPGLQGKGLGKFIVDYIVEKIQPLGATALQLNVNRYNKARFFYEKLGFKVVREEDIDIGNSYFMNDYVMEKKV